MLDSQIISHLCGWDCNCYRHAVQALEYSGKESFSRQVHNQFFLFASETNFFLTGPNWKICGSYPADLLVSGHSGLCQLYWTITIKENKRLFLEPKIFSLENWSIGGKGLGWISFLVCGPGVCKNDLWWIQISDCVWPGEEATTPSEQHNENKAFNFSVFSLSEACQF